MTSELRRARVALACLVEPGSAEVHALVQAHGPEGAIEALIRGEAATTVAGAARARLSGTDPHRIADLALARTQRMGARVVIPEDDEWPAQVADLRRISRPGGQRV